MYVTRYFTPSSETADVGHCLRLYVCVPIYIYIYTIKIKDFWSPFAF